MAEHYLVNRKSRNFEQWVACIEYIQSRNKKLKDFNDFVDFTSSFASSRTLNESRSCSWQLQNGCQYRLIFANNEIKVVIDKPVELYYRQRREAELGPHRYSDDGMLGHPLAI